MRPGDQGRFELCGSDVAEVAVAAFDVLEVIDAIGHGGGQFDGRSPLVDVKQLDLHPRPDESMAASSITAELNDGVPASERVNHKRVARVIRTPDMVQELLCGQRQAPMLQLASRRGGTGVSLSACQRLPTAACIVMPGRGNDSESSRKSTIYY